MSLIQVVEDQAVRNKFSSFPNKELPYYFALILVFLSLITFIPQPQAASAHSSTARILLKSIKEINYYPENDAWTNMWTRFNPAEINNDFARIQILGFNTVRIILQANTGVFDYPTPIPA